MRRTLLCVLSLAPVIAVLLLVSQPAGATCKERLGFGLAGLGCKWDPEAASADHDAGTAQGYEYDYIELCDPVGQGNCVKRLQCAVAPPGFQYRIRRRLPGQAWVDRGTVCIGAPAEITQRVTPGRVRTAFQRLTWPQAELTIQPTGGETLVNLDTIFHTTNPGPITQNITLLGQHIQIEATPTTWTWHWNTTGPTRTTNHPGAPYPRHTITHQYTTTGTTQPSVDVTYTGRYRVNNNPWQDIPGTHTVNGTPQTLTIHQARPHLVR